MNERLTPPNLQRKDLDNKALVGDFLLFFITNDPFVKELKDPWVQNWINEAGLLDIFCRVFLKTEPVTKNIIPWFMLRVSTDLFLLKDVSKEEFKKFIDMLVEKDAISLERCYQLNKKYTINSEKIKTDIRDTLKSITDKNDRADFMIYFFSDAILNSEVRILSWCYEEWFYEKYQINKNLDSLKV